MRRLKRLPMQFLFLQMSSLRVHRRLRKSTSMHSRGKSITVDDIIHRMSNMGFQASSIGDAVNIINKMVS